MKQFGLVLVILGILSAIFAFNRDTTVETEEKTISSSIYSVTIPSERVQNLGLIEQRNNILHASYLAILVGVILYGFGSIQHNSISIQDEVNSSSKTKVTTSQPIVSAQQLVHVLCPKCGNAESVPKIDCHKTLAFTKFVSKEKWGFIVLAFLRMTCKSCGQKFIFDPNQNDR